jgi:D-alanine-D-alanine ligase
MRIGIAYDLRDDYRAMGMSEEETAEFDAIETIDAIDDVLSDMGYEVCRIGNVQALLAKLAAGERWEAVFNFCEGVRGSAREAQVPCILDVYGIPYVFSDALTLAVTLEKSTAKRIVRDHGIPTADFALIETPADIAKVNLPFPIFLKPVAEGSGKGVGARSKVTDKKSLSSVARDLLDRFQQPVLAETFLSGREFTVAILGTGDDARVLGATELHPKAGWIGDGYGFQNKDTGWEERVEIVRASHLPEAKAAGAVALAAWRALRCRDGGRVDIRCDAHGKPHFIEVNPIAGLRPNHSDMCFIADYEGLSYAQLLGRIMESFLKRHPQLRLAKRAAA